MPKVRIFSYQFLLISSFLVLVLTLVLYKLVYDPPKIANIFSPVKEGTLTFIVPETIQVNDPFVVRVEVDTKKQNVNATGVYLRFDPTKLTLIDLDTSQSFCQYYPEKKFNNPSGTITLACGAPHPGVSGANNLMTLKFLPKNVGSADLIVDPKSKILLSNGKGTNILTEYPQERLDILNHL